MSLRLLAAGLAAAIPLLAAPMAGAADLGDEPPPPPRYGSYKDEAPPPPPPRRYSESGCVPKDVVRERLVRAGWGDFRNPEVRGSTALFTASRPSGTRFLLRVDRCSGEIIKTTRLSRPAPVTYVERDYDYDDRYYDRYYDGPRVGLYWGPRYAWGGRGWGHRGRW